MRLQSILRAQNKEKPKILTIYQGHSALDMLRDFSVYAWVVQGICNLMQPVTSNVTPINGLESTDFDLCLSFSGGASRRILQDIANKNGTDLITYELDFPIDIGSELKYRSPIKNSLSPTESFKKAIFSGGEVCLPSINGFIPMIPIKNRPLNVCTTGDFLIETEVWSHWSDWHEIVNTLVGCQVFGYNPRMGTNLLSLPQLNDAFNNSKIYINTRTGGYFPLEIFQAMSCGCAVISYDYPGLRGVVPEQFIVKDKHEARELLSELVSKPSLIESVGEFNLKTAQIFKNNNLGNYINRKWENICEFDTDFFRVFRA